MAMSEAYEEEGKRAFFNKKVPDKLIIDGHVVA